MERELSKEEILTRYLNIVAFGNGAAGIASAARTYFNTTADQLTVPQAALLAGDGAEHHPVRPRTPPAGRDGPAQHRHRADAQQA